ncbi:MAG TPA: alpha/beta hydrolase-fold protein [Cyclobacteriaceae bacterium]|nr:alpha/beta hydrolase-fold protein [Cyclobacteriaceae bacterium]
MKHAKVLLALLLVTSIAFGQKLPAGPQVVTFHSDVDDTEQPYGLYIPKNFDANKKYPLVVMLHGAGSNHRLELRRVFGKSNAPGETDVEASLVFPEFKDVDYIVVSPFARGTMGYQGVAEKDVMDVLADVKKRFNNIDEDRTYLTGLSMGGGGTLWIGLTRPDLWAAIAPVCPAPPAGTEELAGNALNYPAWFHHGDKDQAVPVAVSRDWTKKLKDLGSTVEYTEYPGVNHNSWENAYANAQIFDWFSKFKRNPFPDRVRYATHQYKYNKAYWVTIDYVIPGVLAEIDTKFTGPNTLEVTTAHLVAFTLNLAGHPQYKAGQPLTVTIDGKKIKTQTADKVSFNMVKGKKGSEWVNAKFEPSATAKKAGAEGPVSAATSSRHVYVYGTAGNPSEEELKARREVAEAAANWSVYRGEFLGRIMVFPRVLADKDVRPSDFEAANLVLFGTKETNTLIEKYSADLPLELNASAVKTHGLIYVVPVNNHYVVVNSGLPWWTSTKPNQGRFVPSSLQAIGGLKDFLLFQGGNDVKVAEGYFTNDWTTPDEAKTAITQSGVATVKK